MLTGYRKLIVSVAGIGGVVALAILGHINGNDALGWITTIVGGFMAGNVIERAQDNKKIKLQNDSGGTS